MDAANRRPQLPALSYLDVDKVKREEEAYRHPAAAQTLPPVTAASPTYGYPLGPPPPYSHPPPPTREHANAWPSRSGAHTPPESRRTSGEAEGKHATLQSLPSISEALGVDSQTPSYPASSHAPAPPISTHYSYPQTAAPGSPLSGPKRYGMEPPPLPQHPPNFHTYPGGSYAAERPSLQLQTPQAPPSQPGYSSTGYEPTPPAGAVPPPPASVPYGYVPYPPRYAQPTPPSSTSSGPIYQPSAAYPAPATPSWKAESTRFGSNDRKTETGDYSTSVKRHLDRYDLEGALNDITQTSGILSDFARRYGDRLHQSSRAGLSIQSLPGFVEVDDMLNKSRSQVDALSKIRDVIVAQQAAHDQQMADQRQQQKGFTETSPPAPDSTADAEDSKTGFAGGEAKKRRGRAAPPGRCHSCNRAETPEWRRGPDGARTLCNACGLHYAKLTRKQQGAAKGASIGSSTLRPKET